MTINISGKPQVFQYALKDGELSLKMVDEVQVEGQNISLELTYFLYK